MAMFERFTEPARHVVVFAQDEARTFQDPWIGAEHLLLGLARLQDGIAAATLAGAGLTSEALYAAMGKTTPAAPRRGTGQIPFTQRAKRVLEQAIQEARSLRHGWVGTEHVLLGVLRTSDGGPAAHALYVADTQPQELARRLARTLGLADPDGYAASFPAWSGVPVRATADDGDPHA